MDVPFHKEAVGQWELFDQNGDLLETGNTSDSLISVTLNGSVKYLSFSIK